MKRNWVYRHITVATVIITTIITNIINISTIIIIVITGQRKSVTQQLHWVWQCRFIMAHQQINCKWVTSLKAQSNVTSITEIWSASIHLFAGTWRPLLSVSMTLNYVAIIFHHWVQYRVLSLRYACIRSSGISSFPRLPLCQISFFRGVHCWASPWKKNLRKIPTFLPSLS